MSKRARINQQINTPNNIEKTIKTWQLILSGCSLVGAGFVAGIYVGNYSYSRQIEENNKIIDNLMLHTTLTKELIEENADSTGRYFIKKYLVSTETNRPITYSELDTLYHRYYQQTKIYEILLLRAKRLYQFDFSYKVIGDTIETSIWSKSQTKIIKKTLYDD